MSEFSRFVNIDCTADIVCTGCGDVEDGNGGSENEAENNLNGQLRRDGWEILQNGKPYCGDCVRAAAKSRVDIEEQEQRARWR